MRKHVLDLVHVILPIPSQATPLPNPLAPPLTRGPMALRLNRCVSVKNNVGFAFATFHNEISADKVIQKKNFN